MRLSPEVTPRVHGCGEELHPFMALPRGCVRGAEQLLAEYGVNLAIADQRHDGAPLAFKFDGELSATQTDAARALLAHDTGVFVAPPRIGKTALATYLAPPLPLTTPPLAHPPPP